MALKKTKAISALCASLIGCLVLFQNCSKVGVSDATPVASAAISGEQVDPPIEPPTTTLPPVVQAPLNPEITLSAEPNVVIEGQQSRLTVTFKDVNQVSYMCTDRVSHEILAAGSIDQSGKSLLVTVTKDVHCEVTGIALDDGDKITSTQDLTVDCGNRIKNTAQNKCQDFTCQKVIEITSANDLLSIPPRDAQGLCYAMKLMSSIPLGSSTLTSQKDRDVLSRLHPKGPTPANSNPYLMNSIKTEFRMDGARVVKLSGGLSATAPILSDNYILMGIYPSNQDITGKIASVYRAMGTSDSSYYDSNGKDTNSILFKNTLVPLTPFGSVGTSSIAPVNISTIAEPNVIQTLDLRALDCGGNRQLSDIYLLFQ